MELECFERFSRQLDLLGVEGQEKLMKSSALVVGVGGLGSMVSLLLAYAGIGRLILIDKDVVEESNLNRQVLHWSRDKGRPKVVSAAEKLREINPGMKVDVYRSEASRTLLEELIPQVDVVLDGLDNWRTRFLVDRVAWEKEKPFIHAGVSEYYGQVIPVLRGVTPCLRCIMKTAATMTERPVQVIVPVVAAIASIEALEAIKILSGIGRPSYGKMIVVDMWSLSIEKIDVSDLDCGDC